MPDSPPHRIHVDLGARAYDVLVGPGLLDQLGTRAAGRFAGKKRAAVVCDAHTAPLYGERAQASLRAAGIDSELVTVPAGESSKSLAVSGTVLSAMARAGLDRKSFVVALGGGVIGDLAGFCAAVYQRGVPYLQMPTTLLSMVDSSVGGKTGVNLPEAKNLAGAFHQPALVLADTATLATLPEEVRHEGFAEIIKHAAIRDAAMLPSIEAAAAGDGDLAALIARNVAIKARVVEADEFETIGTRALLNFGHTLGHAIEAAAGYGGARSFLHGEAIALGLRAAAWLSVQKGGLPAADAGRLNRVLAAFGLPLVLPDEQRFADDALINIARSDKKYDQGSIRFVLLRALGDAFVSHEITEADLRAALARLREPARF